MNTQAFMRMMDDLFGTEPSRNIFRLEPERTDALKARIASWDGLVQVIIHPLFGVWQGGGDSQKIEQGLLRILRAPAAQVAPVIIFEDKEFASHLSQWLKYEARDTAFDCYMVETEADDSTLIGFDKECRAYGWEVVRRKFRELGIRRILMGGVRLEIVRKRDWTRKRPYMGQCVGIAFSYLSNRKGGTFEVKLNRKLLELEDPTDTFGDYSWLPAKPLFVSR